MSPRLRIHASGKGKGTATAKVDISAAKPGQQTGFCHHSGQYVMLGIRVDDDGTKRLIFNNNGKETKGPIVTADVIYYHTKIDGDSATLAYSFDGQTPNQLGGQFPLKFGRWRGDRLGFYSWNEKNNKGQIDIDWFRYEYNGPKKR